MAQPNVDELPLGHDTPPHLKAPQESSPKESVHMATCRGLQYPLRDSEDFHLFFCQSLGIKQFKQL